MDRHYRTQVEVLRDLIDAAKREHCKTRIIGLANLNQESFTRYSALAASMGFLAQSGRSYRSTAAAEEWLGAANGVLAKRTELDRALRSLELASHRRPSSLADLHFVLSGSHSTPSRAARRSRVAGVRPRAPSLGGATRPTTPTGSRRRGTPG